MYSGSEDDESKGTSETSNQGMDSLKEDKKEVEFRLSIS
jgi:hypothetical protein